MARTTLVKQGGEFLTATITIQNASSPKDLAFAIRLVATEIEGGSMEGFGETCDCAVYLYQVNSQHTHEVEREAA